MQDNIPPAAGGYTKLSELDDLTWDSWLSLADMATALNTKATSQGATFANGNTYITASGIALLFDHANLTIAKIISIIDHANLTHAKTSSIMNHANFAGNAQKGQEIFDGSADNTVFTNGDHISTILDDWNDNKLTARDNAATTATGFTDRFGKSFRPEWAIVGTPTVSSEYLHMDAGETISISSSFITGTWEFDFQRTGSEVNTIRTYFIYEDGNNSWVSYLTANGTEFDLRKNDAGIATIINAIWAADNGWHTKKITRDVSGNWEILFDGGSKGTALDAFMPTIDKLQFGPSPDIVNTVHFDNLKVY